MISQEINVYNVILMTSFRDGLQMMVLLITTED